MNTTLSTGNAAAEPQLAPPGAGLPAVELRIARLLFKFRRLTGSREVYDAGLRRERDAIARLTATLDDDTASRRVLIARPIGLEDSSRYWSIWMTFDHLRIINSMVFRTAVSLMEGAVPQRVANTANAKPSPLVTGTVVEAYEKSCDDLLALSASSGERLKTRERYAHPWFGPMDALSWYAMAGTHMGLHREQIKRILAGLGAAQETGI